MDRQVYTLTFLEDVTLFDKGNKGWGYSKGQKIRDVSLLDTITHPTGYTSLILEMPILKQRPRVEISSSVVSLVPQQDERDPSIEVNMRVRIQSGVAFEGLTGKIDRIDESHLPYHVTFDAGKSGLTQVEDAWFMAEDLEILGKE